MMRITVGFFCSLALLAGAAQAQSNIGIGTESPHPSAELDVNSSTRGFLPPRMTFAQINTIANPAPGLIVYCTDCGPEGQLQIFQGSSWQGVPVTPRLIPAMVQSLNCSTAINTGTLTQGVAASGVSAAITYTGGNGIGYAAQNISSAGVSGLTATLTLGTLNSGSGTLNYAISGTPASSGTASFQLTIGGKSCLLNITVLPVGSITALNCSGSTTNGTLSVGLEANGVNCVVPYSGGNGGTFIAQTAVSTGVTGLTATLGAGILSNGSGSVTYVLSGVPSAGTNASFVLNLGGKTCTLSIPVTNAHSCGTPAVHNPALQYGTLTDQQGNIYKTIQIGAQTWMAENLKTSRYRNGDLIPLVTEPTKWPSLISGATCWAINDSSRYDCPNGRFYNWFAVADTRNVCPTGWHVPTDTEFQTLTQFLGGGSVAGNKMKSTSLLWSNNSNGINSSGFSALPAGFRDDQSRWLRIGTGGVWWSSSGGTISWSLTSEVSRVEDDKNSGNSIRCIMD